MSGVGHHPAALASLAFEGARFGLATLDADDRLLTANASFRDLMGLSSEQPLHDIEIARLLPIGSALSCSASQLVREGWYEVYSRDPQAESGELLLSVTALEEDGIRLLTLMPRRMVSGGGVSRDALTGLGSPALFRDRLEHALVRAERHEHSFAIMLVELNLPPRPAGLVRWQRWQLLEQVSRRIDKIVDAITTVSIQTNMLAVNGAIEAARAGEFGKGFMVVSTDIRNLARDSSENAERIKDLVKSVQDQIVAVRRDLEETATLAATEVEKNKAVTTNLASIETDMGAVLDGNRVISKGAAEILEALQEAKRGVEQIATAATQASQAANQASQAAREQAKGAEERASAVEEIASLADELQNSDAG